MGLDRLIKNATNKGYFIWLGFLGVQIFLQDWK